MAIRKLSLSKLLRSRDYTLRTIYSAISSSSNPTSPSSSIESHHFANSSYRYLATHGYYRHGDGGGFLTPCKFSSASCCYRSFSTHRETSTEFDGPEGEELSGPGFFDYDYGNGSVAGIGGEVSDAAGSGEEAILPVRCLVWFLDKVHDLTGMPWWMVIVISTLALRVAILPVLLVQLSKLKRNAELAPKLPPPLPPPFSGKSWIEQYKRFRDKRKEIGCPSFLWMLAYPSVQVLNRIEVLKSRVLTAPLPRI